MANQKITDLRSLNLETISTEDLIPVVDVSANTSPTGELKKISVNQLTIALQNRVLASINTSVPDAVANAFIPRAEKGAVNGVTPLNEFGKINAAFIDSASVPQSVYSVFGRTGIITGDVSDYSGSYIIKSGDTMTGNLNVLITPSLPSHSVSKGYLDIVSSSITNNVNNFIFSTNNRLDTKQDSLGFTPIQQGGGIGQATDKIYIGLSGTNKLKASTTGLDIGTLATEGYVDDLITSFGGSIASASIIESTILFMSASIVDMSSSLAIAANNNLIFINNVSSSLSSSVANNSASISNYVNNLSSSVNDSINQVSSSLHVLITSASASLASTITNDFILFTNASSSLSSSIVNNSASISSYVTNVSSSLSSRMSILSITILDDLSTLGNTTLTLSESINNNSASISDIVANNFISFTSASSSLSLGVNNIETYINAYTLSNPQVLKFAEYDQYYNGTMYGDSIAYVDTNNTIKVCGYSDSGRFGPIQNVYAPACTLPLPNKEEVDKFYIFERNCYAISKTGNLYAIGYNEEGQCATGNNNTIEKFTACIGLPSNITKFIGQTDKSGSLFGYALNVSGSLYSWGNNQLGWLGNNTLTEQLTPILTIGPNNTFSSSLDKVVQVVTCGGYNGEIYAASTAVLTDQGAVYCSGYGENGQMGNGTNNVSNSSWTTVEISAGVPLNDIVKIGGNGWGSSSCFYALDLTGTMYSWGSGDIGMLGNNSTVSSSRATAMLTTFMTSSVVSDFWVSPIHTGSCVHVKTNDGIIYTCGGNNYGQLGVGDSIDRTVLSRVYSLSNYDVDYFRSTSANGIPTIFAAITGSNSTQLLVTGMNDCYQIGNGGSVEEDIFAPIPLYVKEGIKDILTNYNGVGYSAVLTKSNQLYACGGSKYGRFSTVDGNVGYFKKITNHING